MNENEKEKEIKNPSETESYEDYKGEGEDAGEASVLDISMSERSFPPAVCQTSENVSVSVTGEEEILISSEERKNLILREKWLTVTGRKPRNIPVIRKYVEDIKDLIFFGDQRPAEVEEKVRNKMIMKSQKILTLRIRYGAVIQEIPLSINARYLASVRFLSSPDYFVTCDRGGDLQIISVKTGQTILKCETLESKLKLGCRTAACNPNEPEKLYAAGDTGVIQVFDLSSGELIHTNDSGFHGFNNLDFSTEGTYLGGVGRKGIVYFFDPSTLQVISERAWPCGAEATMPGLEESYHRMRVYGLKAFPANEHLFASAGVDSTMKIWDVRTVPAIRSIKGPSVHGEGLDIVGNTILTASWCVEDSLNLWDFFSGRLIKKIPIKCKSTTFNGEFLLNCKIFKNYTRWPSLNKKMIAIGGSGFSDILIVHMDTEKVLCSFPALKPVSSIAVNDDLVVYGGMESKIRVGKLPKDW